MASSIPGDRRWASARKGMTVLGKVPKPINLPSQRLENNGLDPNVEIVPKGTLTWGNKPASTTPNAWGLSSKADGGMGSPSHPSGRPSSGGSGTRPSTAGSERSQDPSPCAWGPSSRPSSSSGLLPSSQAHIVSSRPCSAEARPGSSQLSRFAENQGDPQVAWGPSRTSERSGVSMSQNDTFTLNSGDFPTLGSEKDPAPNVRGNSSHGRPKSSCGADSKPKEKQGSHMNDEFMDTNLDYGTVNALKPDNNSFPGSDIRSNAKWHSEPMQAHSYTNINLPPHQFDSWHGPPMQPPDGSWHNCHRGAPGGPYRPPAPPGSYAVDPFMYYPRHFPPNSEGGIRPGTGQDGFNHSNGDQFRPHIPGNLFIIPSRPVIPVRPGAFHAPVAYDGYYPPQMAFRGPANQPGFYNQFQNPNGNIDQGLQSRPSGHNMHLDKEQMPSETAHSGHQAQYKVLLKPHDGSDNIHSNDKKGLFSRPSQFGEESGAGSLKQELEQTSAGKKNDFSESVKSRPDRQVASQQIGPESNVSYPATTLPNENLTKTSDGILSNKPKVSTSAVGQQHYSVTRKNAALFEKIEGLNNKVRNAENQNNSSSYEPEKSRQPKTVNTKHDKFAKFSGVGSSENVSCIAGTSMALSSEIKASIVSRNCKLSGDAATVSDPSESRSASKALTANLRQGEIDHSNSQRKVHAGGNGVNDNGKPRSDGQTQDESTKDFSRRELTVAQTGVISDNASRVGRSGFHPSNHGVVKDLHCTNDLELETSHADSFDYENQRAKLRELAAQRAKQLQKEEEDRTREQKAKALAKLEELNRRSAAQSLKQTHDTALPPDKKSEESEAVTAAKILDVEADASGVILIGTSYISLQTSDRELKFFGVAASMPMATAVPASVTISKEPSNSSVLSLMEGQETEGIVHESTQHSHDSSTSKLRHVGYRQRQKFSQDKNSFEKLLTVDNLESAKNVSDISREKESNNKPPTTKSIGTVSIPVEVLPKGANSEKLVRSEDPSVQQKKRNNRNAKNKIKADEAPLSSTGPSSLQNSVNLENYPNEVVTTESFAETSESKRTSDITLASSEPGLSKASQASHGRANYQLKSQMSRRPRNQQVRPTDKLPRNETIIWAPVKVPNKSEQSEESSVSSMKETDTHSMIKSDEDTHLATKTKRAEIERYVPKPVAKELLQQEILQQSSSFSQPLLLDMLVKSSVELKNSGVTTHEDSSAVKAESVVNSKITEDNKSSRRGRTQASWRQRNPSDSVSSLPNSNEISDQHLPTKPDKSPDKQIKSDDMESNKSSLPMPTESPLLPEITKGHGITGRQRRQHIKFQKPTRSSYGPQVDDSNDTTSVRFNDATTVRFDSNELDAQNGIRTENKNPSGEYTRTHWKPKSHPYSYDERQGNEGTRGTYLGGSDKEFSSQAIPNVSTRPMVAKGGGVQQRSFVSKPESKLDTKRSSNVDMPKNHPSRGVRDVSPNTELAPVATGIQQEQAPHTARRHSHHMGHFNRGQEANYRSRDFGQDSRKQQYIQGDKRKNYTHFEYQPVGGSNKPGNLVESNSEG